MTSTKQENPIDGFHYRLELAGNGAVEVDLFRLDPLQPEVLITVEGHRASDSMADSVVIAVPVEAVAPLVGAVLHAHRLGREARVRAQAAADQKKKGLE